jgi:MIP family channel proteins
MSKTMQFLRALGAEAFGTFLFVCIGTSIVATAVITDAGVTLWQVALVWGFGVTLAIYAASPYSGAHLNPAVSLAFALFRPGDFPRWKLLPYWASQLAGAVLAGAVVLLSFRGFISRFEASEGIARGEPGSQHSAMMFGEYFPNPDIHGVDEAAQALVSAPVAALVEGLGTAILVLVIFALVDRRNPIRPVRWMTPIFIGLTISGLILAFAPLTQGGWNPARDFGPRIIAFLAGWDSIAIPGPSSGFWAYIVGPLVGGSVGALAYQTLFKPVIRKLAWSLPKVDDPPGRAPKREP